MLIHLLEKIARDKAAWSEAAKTDPDFLNLGKLWKKYACIFYFSIHFYCRCRTDEFLSFRHPESSHTTLLGKADDLLGEYGELHTICLYELFKKLIFYFIKLNTHD